MNRRIAGCPRLKRPPPHEIDSNRAAAPVDQRGGRELLQANRREECMAHYLHYLSIETSNNNQFNCRRQINYTHTTLLRWSLVLWGAHMRGHRESHIKGWERNCGPQRATRRLHLNKVFGNRFNSAKLLFNGPLLIKTLAFGAVHAVDNAHPQHWVAGQSQWNRWWTGREFAGCETDSVTDIYWPQIVAIP